ncbi:unnamed protein product [Polarella glacialis]|uniref:Uncharacterized protein n=1 Tax=Polarella glacialis TaxID=89957 RepID=A0A813EBV2_POLGL|nr:unnamed protein product [Polarella glacialis]
MPSYAEFLSRTSSELHATHRERVSNIIKRRQLLTWLLAAVQQQQEHRSGVGPSKVSKVLPQEAAARVLAFLGDAWEHVDCTALRGVDALIAWEGAYGMHSMWRSHRQAIAACSPPL